MKSAPTSSVFQNQNNATKFSFHCFAQVRKIRLPFSIPRPRSSRSSRSSLPVSQFGVRPPYPSPTKPPPTPFHLNSFILAQCLSLQTESLFPNETSYSLSLESFIYSNDLQLLRKQKFSRAVLINHQFYNNFGNKLGLFLFTAVEMLFGIGINESARCHTGTKSLQFFRFSYIFSFFFFF